MDSVVQGLMFVARVCVQFSCAFAYLFNDYRFKENEGKRYDKNKVLVLYDLVRPT